MESNEEACARIERRIERMLEHGRLRHREGYEQAVRELTYARHLTPTEDDVDAWFLAVTAWAERGRERCDNEAPPSLSATVLGRFPFAARKPDANEDLEKQVAPLRQILEGPSP